MKKKNLIGKLVGGVLVGVMLLSSGGMALANDSTPCKGNPPALHGQHQFSEQALKDRLDKLVKDGVMSKAQEDKLIAFMKKKTDERKSQMDKIKKMSKEERRAMFKNKKPRFEDELVKEKIITQAQADKIADFMKKKREERKNKLVNELVQANIFSKEQAESIVKTLKPVPGPDGK